MHVGTKPVVTAAPINVSQAIIHEGTTSSSIVTTLSTHSIVCWVVSETKWCETKLIIYSWNNEMTCDGVIRVKIGSCVVYGRFNES